MIIGDLEFTLAPIVENTLLIIVLIYIHLNSLVMV